jgi:hypothetical protein
MGNVAHGTTFQTAARRAHETCEMCGGKRGSGDPRKRNSEMPGVVHVHTDMDDSHYEPCPECFKGDPETITRGAREAAGHIYGTAEPLHNVHLFGWKL